MSETKTYVFPESGNNGGGGMMAMLAPLLHQKGIDPNLLVAMNSRNNSGFGGEGSWFIWVIFLFFLIGWGNNGWGNGGFGGGNVMEIGLKYFGFAGSEVVAHYSLPSFQDNFKEGVIVNEDIQAIVAEKIEVFLDSLVSTEATPA